jgi:hypothetical protein
LDRDRFLDLKEVIELIVVNIIVDISGENSNNNDICVLRDGIGQRNELCFKTAYSNCECECVNATSGEGRLCLELFHNVLI